MKDINNKNNPSNNAGIKPAKRGRKPIFSDSMTPAQRKAKQRREQDAFILENDACLWTESDCLRVLNTKKFSSMVRFAWDRYGEIKGFK